MNKPATPAYVLSQAAAILLDFDGPICAVFAGVDVHEIADSLRRILIDRHAEVPATVSLATDPLDVLRFAGSLGAHALVVELEDELRGAELRAVRDARPTPHSREAIIAAYRSRRPIAVVSNNSGSAIEDYLNAHELRPYIAAVIGRAHGNPGAMKPSPEPIKRALAALKVKPAQSVMIGDSVSDITAARLVGVRSIAYINKPEKRPTLADAQPDAIIDSMAQLASVLSDESNGPGRPLPTG